MYFLGLYDHRRERDVEFAIVLVSGLIVGVVFDNPLSLLFFGVFVWLHCCVKKK